MPLCQQPERLAVLVGHALGISPPEMLCVEDGPDGTPWFVGFEWNGDGHDFLNEATSNGTLKRGSNSTSADAFVQFRNADKIEMCTVKDVNKHALLRLRLILEISGAR
jgi:hypothetical protein